MCISNSNTVKLLKLKPKGEYAEGSKKKQLVQGHRSYTANIALTLAQRWPQFNETHWKDWIKKQKMNKKL